MNIIKKYYALTLLLLIFGACSKNAEDNSVQEEKTEDAPLYTRMADSEMIRNPDPRLLDFRDTPKWSYTNGLICSAFLKVWEKTGDEKYYTYVKSYADSMITEDGDILTYKKTDYNIDNINSGKFLIELYKDTKKKNYKMALDTLRDQMRYHPRTSEGGFWHKKRYPSQMWLDGLYMGSPFLAQYAKVFNEPELFSDVANQIYLIDKYTWVDEEGLYYHAWDESREQKWADQETGRSPHSWGRAMGWFSMAIVDVLDYFPKDHEKYQVIRDIHKKMADAIVASQDESGLWWQVLDQPGREGNYLEASVSAMFTYFLLKSVNKGYLDNTYEDAGRKAYEAICSDFIVENPDGTISLTRVCGVAGLGGDPYRDGSFDYYINEIIRNDDPKGVGPFIMASLEMEQLQSGDE